MRSCRTITLTCVPVVLCALFAGCSEGPNRQSNMLADALNLNCEAIASAARSAGWTTKYSERPEFLRSQLLLIDEVEAVQQHFREIGYDLN